tara:strand:- start:202 stop:711 length:510 start_codon:yes stop_codon:yes gene_type:complete
MDKDEYIWKQRNEILHKKVNRQMTEIRDLNKKSETIFDLARRFPNKTYRELERYKNADRQEEAQSIPLTESQKSQDELEPLLLTESRQDVVQKEGVCIIGEARKDREKPDWKEKTKELEEALANSLAISESHQKLNGKLQERLTEVEEENKKLKNHFENRIDAVRKSGM